MKQVSQPDPLVVDRLSKTYPGPVEAVRGISFRVRAGEIFGLLGPNGAGKTTTLGVLTTVVRPTGGSAIVDGHDVRDAPLDVRRAIGVVFQESVLHNEFTGAENLRLHARLWRVPDAGPRIASLLAAVGLAGRAGDGVSQYSGGMRRRLEIARALLASPRVLLLDEPTLGLDPIVRRDLWQVVRRLRERYGVTILLSTHHRPRRDAQRRLPAAHLLRRPGGPGRRHQMGHRMSAAAGFAALYQRRLALAVKSPVALIGQMLAPVLWVLVVGPALANAFGGASHRVDYFTFVAVGQIAFVLPFSAMFAGLVVMQDRDFGILRELLVAPIRRSTIPLATIAAVLTVGGGQVALVVALAAARGAHLHMAVGPLLAAIAAAALLTAGTYGLAEYLAYSLTQPQIYGTLIPAIGVTPYLLSGAIYPLATLSAGVRDFALILPWTHAVALLRYGFIGKHASGLDQIWHLQSQAAMTALSLAVLAAYTVLTIALAMRAFRHSTLR